MDIITNVPTLVILPSLSIFLTNNERQWETIYGTHCIYIYSLLIEFPTGKRVFKINSRTQAVIRNMFSLIKCLFV